MPELVATMAWAPHASLAAAQTFATVMEQKWDQQTDWSFTIFHEQQVAGTVTLMRYQALFALCEIGYWLRSDLAGRGLMTEAAAAVCDFGFDRMRIHRIELRAAVENPRSQRVAEKLGFLQEARLTDAGWVQTGFQDMFLYALLSSQRPWS